VTVGLLLLAGCQKVPFTEVGASFSLADATWFAEEQTLFLFYRVDAQQGIGPESQVELAYSTDVDFLNFTALSALTPVHTHLPVDCGPNSLCGSMSLKLAHQPTRVALRMVYHAGSALSVDAPALFNIVAPGPAYASRSLVVYGVFDETNTRVQWRSRNQFPNLRNEEAQFYGLRRSLLVEAPAYGELDFLPGDDVYAYAAAPACPDALVALNHPPLVTQQRAIFDPLALPIEASASGGVCARSTVTDAQGTFIAPAWARKNPDAKPPFPSLHSPIKENAVVGLLLRPCLQDISEEHRAMQQQRLLLPDGAEECIDDWQTAGFVDRLVSLLRARIDAARPNGKDMVLSLALHHADSTGRLAAALEAALQQVLPFERDRPSPRVSGAFVFDSVAHDLKTGNLKDLVLWCPANLPDAGSDLNSFPSVASHTCPLLPETPDVALGPVKFNILPILPTRAQYLNFIAKYSVAQAGSMTELHFLAPERTTISQNVLLGDFGVVTFFDNEQFSAAPTDTFSFCASKDSSQVAFRSAAVPTPNFLSALPDAHAQDPQPAYELGLGWDFPFLLRLKYQSTLGADLTVFSLSVPFGIGSEKNDTYGASLWAQSSFDLSTALLKCTRFCDHPTFNDQVYAVGEPFDPTYRDQCYHPSFPDPASPDGGFPNDP
jgi:hypothetical protein